jgi:hypothetical protein
MRVFNVIIRSLYDRLWVIAVDDVWFSQFDNEAEGSWGMPFSLILAFQRIDIQLCFPENEV